MNSGGLTEGALGEGQPNSSFAVCTVASTGPSAPVLSAPYKGMTVDKPLTRACGVHESCTCPVNAKSERPSPLAPSALSASTFAGLGCVPEVRAPPASYGPVPTPIATTGEKKSQSDNSGAQGDFLLKRTKHVFILTSAGKPIFSRYGNEDAISELFGVFQVLITMAQQRRVGGALHWISAPNLTIYFHVDGGLYYVLLTRGGESPYSCRRQLKQLHYQLLSLVPNVNDILSNCPSYDLRRLVSPTDGGVLRQLIKRNSTEECYIFRCLSASPLSVVSRSYLTSVLSQHYRSAFNMGTTSEDESVAADCHLFSFFFFRGRVVCMVGLSDGKLSLHIDDTLILLNFARCLPLSQVGEIWAPICLPRYNDSGYLWCYCADMAAMVSELELDGSSVTARLEQKSAEGAAGNTTSADTGRTGLLLVQVASSQLAFAPLSAQAHCMAQMLKSSMAALMDELIGRENVPLSLAFPNEGAQLQEEVHDKVNRLLAMANQRQHDTRAGDVYVPPSLQLSPLPVHPWGLQWFAVILKQPSNIIYSEPSPAMRLDSRVRKRQLRLVVRLRYELAMRPSQSEQLLILNTEEVNVVVMKPTPGLLSSLLQQFGSRSDWASNISLSNGGAISLCNHLQELLLLFSPHVPKHLMLLCAVGVAVGVTAHEAELSLQQPRGSKSRIW